MDREMSGMAELEPVRKPRACSPPPPSTMHLEGTATYIETGNWTIMKFLLLNEFAIYYEHLLVLTALIRAEITSYFALAQVTFLGLEVLE